VPKAIAPTSARKPPNEPVETSKSGAVVVYRRVVIAPSVEIGNTARSPFEPIVNVAGAGLDA
jgi:hypothetical protein